MGQAADDAAYSRSSGGQPPPPGDRELVALALDHADAFAELYRRHVRDVHAYITRRCGSSVLADDITAAAFERALRNLRGFRWRDGGFRAWVFRIAANELTDHHRREQATARRDARLMNEVMNDVNNAVMNPVLDEAGSCVIDLAWDPAARVDDHLGSDDTMNSTLRAALAALRPRHQEAVTLRHLSGLTPTEAAAAMQMTTATFAVTLHRAMRALRNEMHQRHQLEELR
jgi:RNA polymerase sigma-70 factor (ECF subfamily)